MELGDVRECLPLTAVIWTDGERMCEAMVGADQFEGYHCWLVTLDES